MHSSAGTRAVWGLTWLTTDITPSPSLHGWRDRGCDSYPSREMSESRRCQRPALFSLSFLVLSFSRIQSLEQFCAFLECCRVAEWFGSERSITEAEGQHQCWFNEVTVSHSRKLHIFLLKHTQSRNTSHRNFKPGDTHTNTHTKAWHTKESGLFVYVDGNTGQRLSDYGYSDRGVVNGSTKPGSADPTKPSLTQSGYLLKPPVTIIHLQQAILRQGIQDPLHTFTVCTSLCNLSISFSCYGSCYAK